MLEGSFTRPPLPVHERDRLAALRSLDVLDSPNDQELDDLVQLAAQTCGTPIALISLVDEKRQWFKARHGLAATQTSREVAFCAHAILQQDPLVINDAFEDDRFKGNPLVQGEPRVRFYAGAPLQSSEGHALGTLCVIDHQPRELTEGQIKSLSTLSRMVVAFLENKKLQKKERFSEAILSAIPDLVCFVDRSFRYRHANAAYTEVFGLSPQEILGLTVSEVIGVEAFERVKPRISKNIHRRIPIFPSGALLRRSWTDGTEDLVDSILARSRRSGQYYRLLWVDQ